MTAQENDDRSAFVTPIETAGSQMIGPWRSPRQMLSGQSYDDHASIHDDATAQKLGFKGGTIEGPTHFSQFAPLGVARWGRRFLERGCISAHYRTAVYEGERVRARVTAAEDSPNVCSISLEKEDGAEALKGTMSVGPEHPTTALDQRLAALPAAEPFVILEGVRMGARTPRTSVRMAAGQRMGSLYPFTLTEKLARITEASPWYSSSDNPYGRAIIPIEMISVLFAYTAADQPFYARGPVVGLFADQEIRLIEGPLFVDEPYELDREVVALSGSRRTESLWVRSCLYRPGGDAPIATMLLNSAILKESYADYETERKRLYGIA